MGPDQLPLRDLHLPEPINWWPLAPGWWLVIALVLFALGWLLWQAWRKYQFHAPRRYAIRELATLESEYLEHRNPVTLGQQLSIIAPRDDGLRAATRSRRADGRGVARVA